MRSFVRALVGASVSLILISLALLYLHHDDWREHVHGVQSVASNKLQHYAEEYNAALLAPPPPAPAPFKAVVMGALSSEDTSWVSELPEYVPNSTLPQTPTNTLQSWEPYVYAVDNTSSPLHTPQNRAREAMPYLTYIIDNYARLGETVAFVHAHRSGFPESWHTDNEEYSNVLSLRALRPSHVQRAGYANLRCNHAVGCDPPEMQLLRSPRDPARSAENALAEMWGDIMGPDFHMPEEIGVACCAQFAVSRERIRRLPRERYVRFREWLVQAPLDDDVVGRVMEYLWHIIFGMDAVFCPDLGRCYCDVYGWCAEEG